MLERLKEHGQYSVSNLTISVIGSGYGEVDTAGFVQLQQSRRYFRFGIHTIAVSPRLLGLRVEPHES